METESVEDRLFAAMSEVLAPHKPLKTDAAVLVNDLVTRLVREGIVEPTEPDEELYRQKRADVDRFFARAQTANVSFNIRDPSHVLVMRRLAEEMRRDGHDVEHKPMGLFIRHRSM